MDYTAVGDTTNVAARLQALAEPGSILIGESTSRAVRTHVDCRLLGLREFKGKSAAIPVYQVVGTLAGADTRARDPRSRGASVLIGRTIEAQTLQRTFRQLATGVGGIVAIVGEAGLGKSRLLAEARKIAQADNCRWLAGNAVSFGSNLTYWPFLVLLRDYFAIGEQDNGHAALLKVDARLRELFSIEEAQEFLPYLATMLALPLGDALAEQVKHLDGLAMGHQVYRSVRRVLERLATIKPTVVVLDDWHWADLSSGDLLEHLLPLSASTPILFIVAARPDADTPAARLPLAIRDRKLQAHTTEIRLTALSREESEGLSRQLLNGFPLPLEIRDPFITKVGGNPFFIEEMIRMLIALNVLVWDESAKSWLATARLDQIQLPDNVQGVVSARIDRLDDSLKQLLKTASVIGESFFYRVLQQVAHAGEEIDGSLTDLQQFEFILERMRVPELDYIFKHPLVKEAAYQSILMERRRSLHRSVGECIEILFAEQLEKFYAVLAFHFARAEDWDKAQEYLLKAGDHAGEVAGNAEAVDHYRQAIAASSKVANQRWTLMQRAMLHHRMGEALFRLGDFQAALAELKEALQLLGEPYPRSTAAVRLQIGAEILRMLFRAASRRLGAQKTASAAEVEINLARFHSRLSLGHVHFTFDHERTVLDSLASVRFAEKSGHPPHLAIAVGCLGTLVGMIGLHRLARHYGRRAIAVAEASKNPLAIGFAYHTRGVAEGVSGEFTASIADLERSSECYRGIGHLHFWAGSRCFLAMALLSRGDPRSLAVSRDLLAKGEETGDRTALGWGHLFVGICLRQQGDYETAIQSLEIAIPVLEAVPDRNCIAWAEAELGVCYARLKKFEPALAKAEQARSNVRRNRAAGYFALNPLAAVAETWILAVDELQISPREREIRVRGAGSRCRTADRWARIIQSEWAAETPRLLGSWHWLAGRHKRAEKEWRRGLRMAERFGARHAMAETRFEIGRRLARPEEIARAIELFSEMQTARHVTRCRQFSLASI